MSSKYINSKFVYQQEGIDCADDHYIDGLLQTHLQNALLEIDALKAQVNYLRDVLLDERKRYHVAKDLDEALEATPEHCLAEVKAKAIEEMIAEFNKTRFLGTSLTKLVSDYVTQLREQAK